MKNILVATDLTDRSDKALGRAVQLSTERDAKLTVLHVVDADLPAALAGAQEIGARQTIQEKVDSLATGGGSAIPIEVVFGRPYAEILEMAEKTSAELLVIGTHRKDSFRDMFRGTTAERVIRAGSIPVLLVKEQGREASYRRIMVGVDFSVYSRRAVEFAIRFVPNGEFQLVHAYDVPFKGFLFGDSARQEVGEQHRVQFERMIDEEMAAFVAASEGKAPKLEPVMREGAVREVILQQTAELKPDLLVIGTHGRTGVAQAYLGSVAEDLLNEPPCDVLAVKAW